MLYYHQNDIYELHILAQIMMGTADTIKERTPYKEITKAPE